LVFRRKCSKCLPFSGDELGDAAVRVSVSDRAGSEIKPVYFTLLEGFEVELEKVGPGR
jgi:hypothetical protein